MTKKQITQPFWKRLLGLDSSYHWLSRSWSITANRFDLVLLINGLPLINIEQKRSDKSWTRPLVSSTATKRWGICLFSNDGGHNRHRNPVFCNAKNLSMILTPVFSFIHPNHKDGPCLMISEKLSIF